MVLLLSFPNTVGADNQEVYIVIESPRYPIEGRGLELKVWTVNQGNHPLNGTLKVRARQDSRFWPETEYNVTDLKGNSSQLFSHSFFPTMGAGGYIIDAKLYNNKGTLITESSHFVTVRSWGETATIVAAVLAAISVIIVISRR
jgi:hypothetical protein